MLPLWLFCFCICCLWRCLASLCPFTCLSPRQKKWYTFLVNWENKWVQSKLSLLLPPYILAFISEQRM
jgi:hypothetical protein